MENDNNVGTCISVSDISIQDEVSWVRKCATLSYPCVLLFSCPVPTHTFPSGNAEASSCSMFREGCEKDRFVILGTVQNT